MPRGRGINLYWAGRGRDSFLVESLENHYKEVENSGIMA